jgi:hypothetical protein
MAARDNRVGRATPLGRQMMRSLIVILRFGSVLREFGLHPVAHVASSRALVSIGILAASLFASVFPVRAASDQQIGWCNGSDNATPELSIRGCTAMIESGEYAGDELAIAFNNRGIAYFKNGQSERAVQDYDQAIRLSPNFFNALSGRCWNRAIVGRDLTGAIADCNRALALNPTITYTRGSRGFAYLKMNNYGAAIADFDAALKGHPENAPSLYGRGLAKSARGDAAGASADLTAAERLDPAIVQKFVSWGVNAEAPPPTKAAAAEPAAPFAAIAPRGDQGAPSVSPAESPPRVPESVGSAAPEEQSTTPPAVTEGTLMPPARTIAPLERQSATPTPRLEGTALTATGMASSATKVPSDPPRAVAPPAESTALPPTAGGTAISAPPESQPPAAEQTASMPLSAAAMETLVKRGDELLSTGDVVAARFVYERAASSGNRAAATGVAKTYDPVFLAQSGVRGLRGDPEQAAFWYDKAAAAGDHEAQERLKRLRARFPQQHLRD